MKSEGVINWAVNKIINFVAFIFLGLFFETITEVATFYHSHTQLHTLSLFQTHTTTYSLSQKHIYTHTHTYTHIHTHTHNSFTISQTSRLFKYAHIQTHTLILYPTTNKHTCALLYSHAKHSQLVLSLSNTQTVRYRSVGMSRNF